MAGKVQQDASPGNLQVIDRPESELSRGETAVAPRTSEAISGLLTGPRVPTTLAVFQNQEFFVEQNF